MTLTAHQGSPELRLVPVDPDTGRRPTVLVVGSGFGGFNTAKELERRLPAQAADIVLASPDGHLTYGPLLPNVAAGVLEPRHATVALHSQLRRTRHLDALLQSVDLQSREATLTGTDGSTSVVRWDRLVLAPGAVTRLPPVPGLSRHALGLKTLTDAVALRDHVIEQLDAADATDDPARRRAHSTFVVVGAGYTGLEAITQLSRFIRRAVRSFPRLQDQDLRFVLVDMAERVLPEGGSFLSRKALDVLRRQGIELRLATTVRHLHADAVDLSDGDTVPTRSLVWAAGVTSEPVVGCLGLPLVGGRLEVDPHLRVVGADGVYAIGDAAAVPDLTHPGRVTAPTAQHAQRQGKAAGRNVAATLGFGTELPYRHGDLGMVVDLGPWSAVARPLGLPLWGPPAALVTRGYHLLALPSGPGRTRVLLDWLLDLLVRPQLARVGRRGPAAPTRPDRRRTEPDS